MWVPKRLAELFTVNREVLDQLKTDTATLKATNLILERELAAAKLNFDWARVRINQLEIERVRLLEKAYPGLSLPAPELARLENRIKDGFDLHALFEDQGDPAEK